MRKLILLAGISMLAACGGSDAGEGADAGASDEYVPLDLSGMTGPSLVTMADESQILRVSAADGVEYSGALADQGSWTDEDGSLCITTGEGEKSCYALGAAGDDGSASLGDEGNSMASLGDAFVAGETPLPDSGSYLVTYADGATALAVLSSVGTSYYAPAPAAGTWSSADGSRCSQADGAETCYTPGVEAADGSFTAAPADGGDEFRVMPIF